MPGPLTKQILGFCMPSWDIAQGLQQVNNLASEMVHVRVCTESSGELYIVSWKETTTWQQLWLKHLYCWSFFGSVRMPSGQPAYSTAFKTYDILRHNLACIILAADDNLLINFVQFDTLQVAWIVLFRQAACHNTLSAVVFAAPFLALRSALGWWTASSLHAASAMQQYSAVSCAHCCVRQACWNLLVLEARIACNVQHLSSHLQGSVMMCRTGWLDRKMLTQLVTAMVIINGACITVSLHPVVFCGQHEPALFCIVSKAGQYVSWLKHWCARSWRKIMSQRSTSSCR